MLGEKNTLKDEHLKYYPNSIVSEYLRKTNKNNDIKVLSEVCNTIKNKKNIILPSDNELVIHVRLGDVIENSKYSAEEHWNEYLESIGPGIWNKKYIKWNEKYIQNKTFFENILKKIKNIKQIDKIILVWGDHQNLKSLKKSKYYIKLLKNFFNKNNYKVDVFFNRDADEDFIYMSYAKYFVSTGGGFSALICKMVEYNNNNVLHKTTDKFID